MSPRAEARRQEVRDFKRQQIIDAARSVFAERGLAGASLRSIARAAGYTPAAIYFYYADKDELYAAVLGESLDRLFADVARACSECEQPTARARAAALAFYDFYAAHPKELDLGLYLFEGIDRRGLSAALDQQLNDKLVGILDLVRGSLEAALGLSGRAAELATASLTCHLVGCLSMDGTGRLTLFRANGRELVEAHLGELLGAAD